MVSSKRNILKALSMYQISKVRWQITLGSQICLLGCSPLYIITAAAQEQGWHLPLSCGVILFPHLRSPKKRFRKTEKGKTEFREIYKESEWIKVDYNRVKQMTLIISLFSFSISNTFSGFMCFELNKNTMSIYHHHHHHHHQWKLLRMAKKKCNLLRCNKNNLRESSTE